MRCIACNALVEHSEDSDYCPSCLDIPEDKIKFYCLEDVEDGVTIPPVSIDYKLDDEDIEL